MEQLTFFNTQIAYSRKSLQLKPFATYFYGYKL